MIGRFGLRRAARRKRQVPVKNNIRHGHRGCGSGTGEKALVPKFIKDCWCNFVTWKDPNDGLNEDDRIVLRALIPSKNAAKRRKRNLSETRRKDPAKIAFRIPKISSDFRCCWNFLRMQDRESNQDHLIYIGNLRKIHWNPWILVNFQLVGPVSPSSDNIFHHGLF